jgi:hypothetical protein
MIKVDSTVQVPFLQHFVFFKTYEWAQLTRVFVPGKLSQPTVIKYTSLGDP